MSNFSDDSFDHRPDSTISIDDHPIHTHDSITSDKTSQKPKDTSQDLRYNSNDTITNRVFAQTSSHSKFNHNASSSETNVLTKDFYKTIVFMDYRRLRRRFNGIRKPISYKRLLLIFICCVILVCLPLLYVEVREENYLISLRIGRELKPFISLIAFVLLVVVNARFQLKQALKWPVILSYISILAMGIGMLISRTYESMWHIVHLVMIYYCPIQLFILLFIYVMVRICPLLALKGFLFPCGDHFRILSGLFEKNRLLVVISRYNDYFLMCGGPVCGLPRCLYQSTYRLITSLCIRIRGYVKSTTDGYGEAPFSHQMRYNGRVDDRGRPHGYGEWLEDHSYGERLKGYWWHGYPIGPFSSQEIGSGSIFANTRVAFVTNTESGSDIKYGVACTECSISGHFFRYFPVTYFFHPRHSTRVFHGNIITKSLYKNDFFRLMQPEFDQSNSATMEWCFKMLKSQFWLNMPKRITSCTVNVDRWSGLRIEGFVPKPINRNKIIRVRSCTDTTFSRISPFNRYSVNVRDRIKIRIANRNTPITRVGDLLEDAPKSQLFVDEDKWANMDKRYPIVSVDGWIPIRSLAKCDKVCYEAIIFVHGYNLTLSQACAQLSHFISFSKLPPYIIPFLFHWPGKYWSFLSAFAYPLAKKSAESENVGIAMAKFLLELQRMGISRLHFLAHSCGARAFFNGLHHCISQGIFRKIIPSEDDDLTQSRSDMVLQSCILLNPDYSLDKFVDYDFFMLRSYCESIIIYADTRDQCLTMAGIWNRERVVGKSIFGLVTNKSKLGNFIANHNLAKSFTLYPELFQSPDNIAEINCDSVEMQSEEILSKFSWLNPRKTGRCRPSWKGLNYNQNYQVNSDANRVWLDLDVVDMSAIDSNVDFLKHSSYQMKREIMDDIREVILLGNRAEDRRYRLDRRRGNVHVLRIAPASISQLWGD